MKRKVYFENLDGLRFIAFLSVFLFHSFYTPFDFIKEDNFFSFFHFITRYGWLGVNFFFVLSGFLITYLLLVEEQSEGKINIFKFYMRRILRIWPLYYLIVFFCFVIYPILSDNFADTPDFSLPNIYLFLFHLSNYSYIYNPSDIPTLNILWTISIEEQFYLIWPLVLLVVKKRKRFVFIALLILISIIFQWIYKDDFHYSHHHIITNMSDLAIGGLSALLIFNVNAFRLFIEKLSFNYILTTYTFISIYFLSMVFNMVTNISLLTALSFSFIILEQNFSVNSIFKISKVPFVSYLGTITYGLYCYHYLSLLLAIKVSNYLGMNKSVFGVLIFENLLGLSITIVVSIISYRIFEKPFLKLKSRFSF